MNYLKALFITVLLLFYFNAGLTAQTKGSQTSNVLFLDQPAANWNEAFPIGNGSLGGMVYGGVDSDTIKLNEETLWSGEPRDLQNYTGRKHLPRIRSLLNAHKTDEAQSLIDSVMLGEYNECYLPMGDLIISIEKVKDYTQYSRELSLDKALVTTEYIVDKVGYKKEVFTSYPDQAMIIRLTADQAGSISCSAELSSLLNYKTAFKGSQIILDGQAPLHAYPHYVGKKEEVYEEGRGMKFQIRLEVITSRGSVKYKKDKCYISKADTVEFRLVASTGFNGFDKNPARDGKDFNKICESRLNDIRDRTYQELLSRHEDDYSNLFHRVSLDLGADENSAIPNNERIVNYAKRTDPALTALYFQFGRYLLISSSRPGKFAQPANLQGIWSRSLQPPWSANWTLNCNAEINYWPATITNLLECHIPLIEMTKELSVDGAKTAKNLYGSRGWIAHHNADIWRSTSPVDGTGLWAIYQVGSAWLCHHLWEQFEYSQDLEYLKEVYPFLRDAALFYVDNLQRDEDGFLVSNPSESFENHFKKPDGKTGWACVGATQDMQIIRDLFRNTIMASKILDEDNDFTTNLIALEKDLLPMRISPTSGRLQEWKDDWQAASPNGGQVAHGWGLAVGNQISPLETPELAEAFQKTLEYRRPWESYNCGSWVGSFAAKFWARLGDGNMTQTVLSTHIQKAVSPNMTSNFQGGFWEIDGNLGITASIAEMFLQSHTGEIVFLPGLPSAYPKGSVLGLRARGGFLVDIHWENGILSEAELEATVDGTCVVRYKDMSRDLTMKKGERILIKKDLSISPLPQIPTT